MKLLKIAMLLAIPALTASAFAADKTPGAPVEREISVGVADVLIPGGFDSTSDVSAVVTGVFPNGCYRWSRAAVSKTEEGVIEVSSKAIVREGMCLMVLVPYTKEVSLGRLGKGNHVVHFVNGDGTYLEKRISIEE